MLSAPISICSRFGCGWGCFSKMGTGVHLHASTFKVTYNAMILAVGIQKIQNSDLLS